MAILLYIHCIFVDHHDSPDTIRFHVKSIRANIVEQEMDRDLSSQSVEMLLWLIFKDPNAMRLSNPARAFQAARMMSIAKQTSLAWLERASHLLLKVLQGARSSQGFIDEVLRPLERLQDKKGSCHT